MYSNDTSSKHPGFRGGLVAALVAFALTWFVVNGSELPEDKVGALHGSDLPLCAVPADKPTSRFLNSPIAAPVPWYGG